MLLSPVALIASTDPSLVKGVREMAIVYALVILGAIAAVLAVVALIIVGGPVAYHLVTQGWHTLRAAIAILVGLGLLWAAWSVPPIVGGIEIVVALGLFLVAGLMIKKMYVGAPPKALKSLRDSFKEANRRIGYVGQLIRGK